MENEVKALTAVGLQAGCIVKWIIEIAALSDEEIVSLTELITKIVTPITTEDNRKKVIDYILLAIE